MLSKDISPIASFKKVSYDTSIRIATLASKLLYTMFVSSVIIPVYAYS
jgi:hypothetical protein